MIGKILLLAAVVATQGRRIEVDEQSMIPFDLCPAQGHYLLPHEWDCTKFYYCEYGQKRETPRDCSPGTEFSYALQVCVHPGSANCDLSGVPPESEEVTEAPEPETEAPTEATRPPRPTTEAPKPETEAPEPETEAPEPETEAPEPETEAPTTRPPTPTTEHPTDAPEPETEAPTTRPPRPTRPTTEAPAPETEAPEVETEAPEVELLPNGCPADLDVHQLLPHDSDCGKFYYCVHGNKVVRECGPGTHFNPVEQVCDWPEKAGCAIGGSVDDSGETTEPDNDASTEATARPPRPTRPTTEAPAPETEAPEVETEAPEVELLPNGCPADFDVHQLLPHDSDCGKFYYCVHGNKVVRECGPGTHFNPVEQVCDWPEKAGCAIGGSVDDSGETTEPDNDASTEATARPPRPTRPTTEAPAPETEAPEVETEAPEVELLPNGCPADFDVHQLLPHDSDCGKFYYCVHGNKVVRECGPGTHFNPVEQVCDWPEKAGCAIGGSVDDSGETTEPDNDASTEATARPPRPTRPTTEAPAPETEAPKVETEAPEVELLPNGCPADFDVHQLLPHDSDCGKFYYCVHGNKVVRECGPGTHFNPVEQVCDWPEKAGCAIGGSVDDSGETTEPDNDASTEATARPPRPTRPTTEAPAPETEAPKVETEAPEVELLPNGCPADFDVHQLLPHDSDCGKFYYCVHGNKVVRECGPGTHFNPVEQVCDWPEKAGCAIGGSVDDSGETTEPDNDASTEATARPPRPTRPTTEAPAPETEAPEVETEAPEVELLPNGCPADFDVHQLLPHDSDCGKFYYCVHGNKVVRECGPGTHFNPVEQVCDWPEKAGCAIGGSVDDSGETTEPDTDASIEATTRPPRPTRPTTEAPAPETEEPEVETEAPEVELLPNGCPADFDVHQLLPHDSDCGKFYYCVHGNKVVRECGPGTHFNPVEQVCDWPEEAGCAIGGSVDDSGETTEPDTDASTEATTRPPRPTRPTTEAPAPETEAPEVETEAPEVELLPNGCPADFDVHQLLPHDSDCGKFYYCVHGNKVVRECGPGTHFNPVEQVCDWPEKAGCAIGGSVDDSGETTEPDTDASTEATTRPPRPTRPTTEAPAPETEAPEVETEAPEVELLPNGCPADFDVHQLLPHDSDCGKFYYCVHGNKVVRECGPGTHFNPVEQVCDWPEKAGCAIGGSVDDSGETTEPDNDASTEATARPPRPTRPTTEAPAPETEAPEVETEAPEVELLPNGCPADFDVHQLLPHDSDCGKFYYCVHGNKVVRECGPGTHFNPVEQVCDWPEKAGCAIGGSVDDSGETKEPDNDASTEATTRPPRPTRPTTEAPAPETEAPEVETEAPEVELLPNGCPADFDVHQLLPHDSDCGKFYYCVHGNKVVRECGPGTHFNPVEQVCDWPEKAGCAGGSVDDSGETTEPDTDASTEATTRPPRPTRPTTEAPAPETEAPEVETEAPEVELLPNGCPADFDVHQLLPHDSDCGKFYYCVHGNKVVRECGPGTHFNPVEQVCDWPEKAGCAIGGSVDDSGETTEPNTDASTEAAGSEENEISAEGSGSAEIDNSAEDENDSGNSEEDNGTGGENEGSTERNSGEDENSGETGAENGNSGEDATIVPSEKCQTSCNIAAWAHEHDCDKFWRCDGGNAVLGTCSEGLHFNVNTQTCDFICNAGCVRDDVQSTPEHDGLKLFLPWDKVDERIRRLYLTGRE